MDIFEAVITTGGLVLEFLEAWSAYSDEAQSLKTRFDWDIRVLKVIKDYFVQRHIQKANQQLAAEDAELLERTAKYLAGLVAKVKNTCWKIQAKGRIQDGLNHLKWRARRAGFKELEQEIFEWTKRFDVRVLGLPRELRNVIPAVEAGDDVRPPAVVRSNNRLQEFLALASSAKRTRGANMLLREPGELASTITLRGDVSFHPLQYDNEQIIFASRRVPIERKLGTSSFQDMLLDMGELAGALNCLDHAADIRLLKVEYYFYHTDSNQFLFAQKPPYLTESMMTLEEMITGDPFPKVDASLTERLRLALKLAEAVFFLHTAGFVHKNITSSSVVALRRHTILDGEIAPDIDDSYLMGFDLIRGNNAVTTGEGSVKTNEGQRSIWDFDVFQHPDRLQEQHIPRYLKTYDVYSLGVLLLEVGFWEPLRTVATDLTKVESSDWAKELLGIVPQIGARIGDKYESLVAWCIGLKGNHIVEDEEFVQKVLDPLDDMVNSMSECCGFSA